MHDLDELMEEHSGYLVKIAYLYVKNWSTAEDIVQDVFITFYQKQAQFRQEASLKTYLTTMTANRSKDYLRSWKRKKDVVFETIFAKSDSVEQSFIQQEQLQELEKHLFDLPLKYREPLILYYYNEWPISDIAAFLNLNENTVKTHLRRAKQQLKAYFDSNEQEVWEG